MRLNSLSLLKASANNFLEGFLQGIDSENCVVVLDLEAYGSVHSPG